MKTRLVLVLIFLAGAVASLTLVYSGALSEETTGILSNVGTELIGIVLTVLIIDWMYARRTAASERRSVAVAVLQELDHAVWVWQGDRRGFDLDELFTRVQMASAQDPFPSYTQNLFMRLGSRCVSNLHLKHDSISGDRSLAQVLSSLARLESVRDIERDYDFQEFKQILLDAIVSLASLTGLPQPKKIDVRPTAHLISSEEHQHYRHFGRQIDGSHQPIWYGERRADEA